MIRAFSLIELLVALTIITTAITAVSFMTHGIPLSLATATDRIDAIHHAESYLSETLAQHADAYKHTPDTSQTTSSSVTLATLQSIGARIVTVAHEWRATSFLPTRTTTLESIVTDYANAPLYICSPFLLNESEFSKIIPLKTPSLPPIAALTATRKHLVAVSSMVITGSASLFVFTHSNPELTLTSTYGHASSTIGYVDAAITDRFIYAVRATTCAHSPSNCASLDVFEITSDTVGLRASIPIPPARSIVVSDTYVIVGLRHHATQPEIRIFDIENPANPIHTGSAEIGHTAQDMEIYDASLYVTTTDNSTSGKKGLIVFNLDSIHHSMEPAQQSSQPGAGIGQALYRSDTHLFLGRTSPLYSKELYTFNPDTIETTVDGHDTSSSIVALIARGTSLFTLTTLELSRWHVSKSGHIERYDTSFPLPENTTGSALACSDRTLFIAANTAQHGNILTLFRP